MSPNREDDRLETQFDRLSPTAKIRVNRCCDEFELLWQKNEFADLDEFVRQLSPSDLITVIRELVEIDLTYRNRTRRAIEIESYLAKYTMIDRDWLAALTEAIGQNLPSPLVARFDRFSNKLLGDYTILGPIGSGGMGLVFRAEHRLMGRQVAIKILSDRCVHDAASRLRFEREVRVISKLTHPNIVSAFDAREEEGMLFLVTELIDGVDLASLVKRSGPLKNIDAMYYTWQAAKGLRYAHEQGIIHRDVKPGNLILEKKKTVKVLDLGLARLRDADRTKNSDQQSLTSTSHIVGTAAFMSPEQAKTPNAVDERSDIYSLGCTLYFLICGKPPYRGGSDVETILAHLDDPLPEIETPPDRSNPSEELKSYLLKMLSKSPDRRPATMAEVVEKLAKLIKLEQSKSNQGVSRADQKNPFDWRALIRGTPVRKITRREIPSKWFRRIGLLAALLSSGLSAIFFYWIVSANQFTEPPANRTAIPSESTFPKPTWADGLKFDGNESFVRVPLRAETVSDNFSIEVAVVAISQTTPSNIVTFSGTRCMVIFIANHNWGVAYFDGERPNLIVSEDIIQYGRPTLVAGQLQNNLLSLFLNGVRIPTKQIDYPMQIGPSQLFFGGVPAGTIPKDQGSRFFHGQIVAVRIQSGEIGNPARTLDELVKVNEFTVAMFPLTERSGMYCFDAGLQKLQGQLVNTTWYNPVFR